MNLPSSTLSSITLDINKKIKLLIKKKINDFLNIINLLNQFISTERQYNKIIEDLFIKAFNIGMIYYEKYSKEFNSKDKKIRKSLNDDISKKIDTFIYKMKKENENNKKYNLIEKIRKVNKSSSSIEDEDEEKSKTKNMEMIDHILINNGIDNSKCNPMILSALGIDSNNRRDLFQNYGKIKKNLMDIKIKTSYFSEITINLIFKMLGVDKNDLSNKYDVINITEIGIRINIKNNDIKFPRFDSTEINYDLKKKDEHLKDKNSFEGKNTLMKKFYLNGKNINQNNDQFINEMLDFSKEFHSFLPNNSLSNIISNTSQIIHRKFFQLLLRKYFSDIIDIDNEKNKVLASEPFHLILRVLRKLKIILFNSKNRNYYKDFPFLEEY